MPMRVLRFTVTLAAVLVLWELVGRIDVTGVRVFPAPSAILAQYVADGDIYFDHIAATVRTSAIGFVIGNVIAVAVPSLFAGLKDDRHRTPSVRTAKAAAEVRFSTPSLA
jgi:ABC-type nitrate/sulfonate/bicarbonate transport system permease component